MARYPKQFYLQTDPHEDHNAMLYFSWALEGACKEVRNYMETVKRFPNPSVGPS